MKVGDLVKWESVSNDSMESHSVEHGIIVKMSRTGHTSRSAQVMFSDGELVWLDTQKLSVVNKSV